MAKGQNANYINKTNSIKTNLIKQDSNSDSRPIVSDILPLKISEIFEKFRFFREIFPNKISKIFFKTTVESPSSIESAATVVETNRMTHSSSYVGGIVGGSSNRSSRDSNKTHHVIQSSSSPTSSEQSVPIPVNSQIKKRIQKRIQESNSAAKEI